MITYEINNGKPLNKDAELEILEKIILNLERTRVNYILRKLQIPGRSNIYKNLTVNIPWHFGRDQTDDWDERSRLRKAEHDRRVALIPLQYELILQYSSINSWISEYVGFEGPIALIRIINSTEIVKPKVHIDIQLSTKEKETPSKEKEEHEDRLADAFI